MNQNIFRKIAILIGVTAVPSALLAQPESICPKADNEIRLLVTRQDAPKLRSGFAKSFQDLESAKAEVRTLLQRMKADRMNQRSIRVQIDAGRYELKEPLVFDSQDGGWGGICVTYEGAGKGNATISGSQQAYIRRSLSPAAIATKEVPAVKGLESSATQLYVNGRKAVLAREPNYGEYWNVHGSKEDYPRSSLSSRQSFIPQPASKDFLFSRKKEEAERAVLVMYQSWAVGRHRFSVNSQNISAVSVLPEASWPFLQNGPSQRYYIENIPSALNAPGEWIAQDGMVRYFPLSDDAEVLRLDLPILENLVLISGSAENPVENLNFRQLRFEYSLYKTPANGYVDKQASYDVTSAVVVNYARRITIEDNEFESTGGFGIWMQKGVRDSIVRKNSFKKMGAGAVKIGNGYEPQPQGTGTGSNLVERNEIDGTGTVHPGAVSILILKSWDNTIQFNTIRNSSYSGISIGWQWNFGPRTSGNNIIKGNLIDGVGGNLSDLGGIYTLGESPGTQIVENLISNVRHFDGYSPVKGLGAWGIYSDSASSYITIKRNVVKNVSSGSYHLAIGKENVLEENLFNSSGVNEILIHDSPKSGLEALFTRNIIESSSSEIFGGRADSSRLEFRENLVLDTTVDQTRNLGRICGDGCFYIKSNASGNGRLQSMGGLQEKSLIQKRIELKRISDRVARCAGANRSDC